MELQHPTLSSVHIYTSTRLLRKKTLFVISFLWRVVWILILAMIFISLLQPSYLLCFSRTMALCQQKKHCMVRLHADGARGDAGTKQGLFICCHWVQRAGTSLRTAWWTPLSLHSFIISSSQIDNLPMHRGVGSSFKEDIEDLEPQYRI